MHFKLPELPYAKNALEPHISEKTLDFHYGKHHNAYVTNLNKLTEGNEFHEMTLEEIIMKADGGIFNNAAQIWNHTFYFTSFSGSPKKKPEGKLLDLIEKSFNSFDEFKTAFNTAASTLFGSGWAWLALKDGKLEILQTSNAENPMQNGFTPLLTCDVWEHAYYIDVKNRRPDYINNFWEVLDWSIIENRFEEI